jgi:hypothetical protein
MDSRLRLLLRLVKVVLEFGLSEHAADDCRLGWFRDRSDDAVLLTSMWLLLRVGYVEKAWIDRFVATLVWSLSRAREAVEVVVELTPLAWRSSRWRGRCHFHKAVYLPTFNRQWSYLDVCLLKPTLLICFFLLFRPSICVYILSCLFIWCSNFYPFTVIIFKIFDHFILSWC